MSRTLPALLLVWSTALANGECTMPYQIYNAAAAFGLNSNLLYAICKVESKCNPSAVNHDDGTVGQKARGVVSKSYGMYQIKMGTARGLGFKGTPSQLRSAETNCWYAAKYVKHLMNRYSGDPTKVISAYNAGTYVQSNGDYVKKVLVQYAILSLRGDHNVKR